MKGIYQKLKEQFLHIGMKKQLLTSVLLFAFLPFILIILYMWQYCVSVFSGTISESSGESFMTRETQLVNYTDEYLNLTDIILNDERLTEYIFGDVNPSLTSWRLNDLLRGYITVAKSDLMGIYIRTTNDRDYLVTWQPEEINISIRGEAAEKYREVRNLAASVSEDNGCSSCICMFREMRCTAIARKIESPDKGEAGSMVVLLKYDRLLEIIDQVSSDTFPWAFCIRTEDRELCAGKNYHLLARGGTIQSKILERIGWEFLCAVNMEQIIRNAFARFGLFLLITIAAYIIILLFISKVINKQLFTLRVLRNEMVEIGKDGVYKRIDLPRDKDVAFLFKGYNLMVNKIEDQEKIILEQNRKNIEIVNKQKEAELKAMELEINPHYLYNTLNMINSVAIEHQDYMISRLLKGFSSTLLYMMKQRYRPVTLKEEVEWLNNYLMLQRERYAQSFDYEIDIEPELVDASIYKLLLQPFIENSILHGFERKDCGGLLTVIFGREEDRIKITISDNGKGMPRDRLYYLQKMLSDPMNAEADRLGIINSCRRMQGYYKNRYQVRIVSEEGNGTVVEIWIPFLENSSSDQGE